MSAAERRPWLSSLLGWGARRAGAAAAPAAARSPGADPAGVAYQATLLETLNDAVMATDARLRFTVWNRAAEQLYGWTAAEVLGAPLLDTIVPPSEMGEQRRLKLHLDSNPSFAGDLVHRRKDGGLITVETRIMSVRDEEGRTTGYVAACRDVTERKRAEALREAQLSLQRAILVPGMTAERLASRVLGLAMQLTGSSQGFVATVDPEGGGLVVQSIDRLDDGEQPAAVHARVRPGANGGLGGLAGRATATRAGYVLDGIAPGAGGAASSAEPQVTRAVGAPALVGEAVVGEVVVANAPVPYEPRDLATLERLAATWALGLERLRAESALRQSESRLRLLTSRAPAGIFETDASGRPVFVNDRWRELTGQTEREALATPWTAAVHPEDADRVEREWAAALSAGRSFESEFRVQSGGGRISWLVASAMALLDPLGKVAGYLGIATDYTDTKRMQARLLLADRMASVGTLAAGVAHEINNPLAYIMASIDFSAEEIRAALGAVGAASPAGEHLDDALRALGDAREGSERVRRIIRDLKTFSRPEDEITTRVSVEPLLESCLGIASNEIRHRALVVRQFGGVPAVTASSARLAQVFMNLLINAAQAIPVGKAQSNEIRVVTRLDGSGRVAVEISDTGCGIDPEHMPRVFDPFFTTKPVGEGTGLGLAICHGIVTALGGEIHVESTPKKGSTFRVVLPPAEPLPVPAAAGAPEPAGAARRGRVLVVDDEPLIGVAVRRMLERDHEVVTVTSARAALEQLKSGLAYDAILCDLMMPEMTGMDLYEELGRLRPDAQPRVIFFTGGAFTSRAREFLDRVPNPTLDKPLDIERLLAAVRAMTARRA